jgi:hypothetical protein
MAVLDVGVVKREDFEKATYLPNAAGVLLIRKMDVQPSIPKRTDEILSGINKKR